MTQKIQENLPTGATVHTYHSEGIVSHSGRLAERIREWQVDIEQFPIIQIDDITYMRICLRT